ncbi:hypothetical protein HHL22_20660 [Hymenobacter sp. RP-2-7]|uniref:Uncharacterized protein n=1 Tax=Hymenobacter polaris TaxID=2682546 RepID=A0A7Y0FPJ6_9BACT|nr:hypothetical protein [Hymenobacter polaris]NML67620.1 hypothetical protein [Hymenobacter polaris]
MQLTTNLTSDQVDKLVPGPATDLLVAKHLFRLAAYSPHAQPDVPGYIRKTGKRGFVALPRYSVDGVAGLEVLQLLLDKNIDVHIDSSGRTVRLTFLDRGKGGVDGVAAAWEGTLADLPLALCQAALKLPYL